MAGRGQFTPDRMPLLYAFFAVPGIEEHVFEGRMGLTTGMLPHWPGFHPQSERCYAAI
jgi:hypothetical protein